MARGPTKRGADGLTTKQRRFVEEYLVDSNGTQAALRAGYSAKSRSAHWQARDLFKNPSVVAAIAAGQAKLAQKAGVTAQEVVAELARIGFSDVRRLYSESGDLKPIRELDDEAAAALAGVEVEELFAAREHIGNVRKVKRFDKVRALELLGKHLGLFDDSAKVEVTVKLVDLTGRRNA